MVCLCAMSFNCFWLQILFCSSVNETAFFSFLRSLLRGNGRSLRFPKIFLKKQTRWSNDKTIIELGYRKISWFVSVSQINYLPQPSASANNWSTHHWQNLTNHDKNITYKSRYFAQPGPIIANYLPTLLPNISLVPRRSRLGQSWTLPWAVTSQRMQAIYPWFRDIWF